MELAEAGVEGARLGAEAGEFFAVGGEDGGEDLGFAGGRRRRGIGGGRRLEAGGEAAGARPRPWAREVGQQGAESEGEIVGGARGDPAGPRRALRARGEPLESAEARLAAGAGLVEAAGEKFGALPGAARAFAEQAAGGGRFGEPAAELARPRPRPVAGGARAG